MAFYSGGAGNGEKRDKSAPIGFEITEDGRKPGQISPKDDNVDQLISVGRHCEYEGCHQLDFLPTQCSHCGHYYCTSHYSISQHECTYDPSQENIMPQCPICEQYVLVPVKADANVIMDQHISSGCKANLLKLSQEEKQVIRDSLRCAKEGCSNHIKNKYSTLRCPSCREQVCLTHRLPDDHDCAGAKKRRGRAGGHVLGSGEGKEDGDGGFGSAIMSASQALLARLRGQKAQKETEKARMEALKAKNATIASASSADVNVSQNADAGAGAGAVDAVGGKLPAGGNMGSDNGFANTHVSTSNATSTSTSSASSSLLFPPSPASTSPTPLSALSLSPSPRVNLPPGTIIAPDAITHKAAQPPSRNMLIALKRSARGTPPPASANAASSNSSSSSSSFSSFFSFSSPPQPPHEPLPSHLLVQLHFPATQPSGLPLMLPGKQGSRLTTATTAAGGKGVGEKGKDGVRAPVCVWIRSDWTVGRTVDEICTLFNIQNQNHDPKKPKIHLAPATDPTRTFAFSEKWSQIQDFPVADGMHVSFLWIVPASGV